MPEVTTMKKLTLLAAFFVLLFALSNPAATCACCAERGTYQVWTTSVDSFYDDMLGEMNFGSSPELYMTEAGFESIRGLGALAKEFETSQFENVDLVDAYTKRTWSLAFKTPAGNRGTLILPRPSRMTIRRIYIPDNESTSPNVWLYKELEFKGQVRGGTGFFRTGVSRPAAYTLIFQGQGNNCDSADQFKNWRLAVKGTRADFAFFGKTKAATGT
jgi:hypothetical protein